MSVHRTGLISSALLGGQLPQAIVTAMVALATIGAFSACSGEVRIEGEVFWRTPDGQVRVPAGASLAALPPGSSLDSLLSENCAADSSWRNSALMRKILAPIQANTTDLMATANALEGRHEESARLRVSASKLLADGERAGRSLDSAWAATRDRADSLARSLAIASGQVDMRGRFELLVPKGDSLELLVMALVDSQSVAVWRRIHVPTKGTEEVLLDRPADMGPLYCGER